MKIKSLLLIGILCGFITTATAQKYVSKSNSEVTTSWNGTTFSSNKTISENISGLSSFSFLNSIFEDSDLLTVLESQEMVTLFLPSDAAFNKMTKEDLQAFLANAPKVNETVKFLAVPGRLDLATIKNSIRVNNGTAYFTTIRRKKLGAKLVEGDVVLFDAENNIATLSATDFYHKNGLFHIIDGIISPTSSSEK